MNWEYIFAEACTLFLVLDPLGNVPVAHSILKRVDPKKKNLIMFRELVFVLILLLVFFFLGKQILGFLGLSQGSLNLSGGLLLLLIAVGMIFPSADVMGCGSSESESVSTEPFIVPVAVPLIVGPATISLVMVQASTCQNWTESVNSLIGVVLAWLGTTVVMLFSNRILGYLGSKGTVAMTRLMGTVLVLIAVQMILDGITAFVASLQLAA